MKLEALFEGISRARIGVIGDFCLDMYWIADLRLSELSRETPHHPLPIVDERFSPGGAGNVACNIAALQPQTVRAFGVTGSDWRGALLRQSLQAAGVEVSGLIEDESAVTNTYIKPLRTGISETVYEDPRIDFENRRALAKKAEHRLLKQLENPNVDVLCVCDQMKYGCITPAVRRRVCELGAQGMRVLVDSRDRISLYEHVIVKPNEVEARRALRGLGDDASIARELSRRTGKPAVVTLGGEGCLVCENGEVTAVPARRVEPPVDICGAGDTFLSGLACALSAGAPLALAARFAAHASSITVKKLNTTGTASREELEAIWTE